MKKRTLPWLLEVIVAAGIITGTVALTRGQESGDAEIQAAGKQWLTMMNKDNDNTVDRKEFLDYMSREFTAADADHDGTLDAHELGKLRMKLAYQRK
jgi:Ca2+-binding EF-hand superfamily protein